MTTQFFSTKELSELCAVGETTVKRWSNMGLIKHHKTVGGHRKFKLEDVLEFISKNNIEIPPDRLERLNLEKSYADYIDLNSEILLVRGDVNALAHKLTELLLGFRKNEVEALLSKAVEHGISFATLFDKMIAPAMYRVGELWAQKKLGIGEEHIITNIVIEAVLAVKTRYEKGLLHPEKSPREGLGINVGLTMNAVSQNGRKTDDAMPAMMPLAKPVALVCTCPESEYHEVGLLGVSLVCQSMGMEVSYVGAAVPFKDLERVVDEVHPAIVYMSVTTARVRPATYRRFELFRKFLKKRGVRFILGGQFTGERKSQPFEADFRAKTCTELEQYLRENFEILYRGTGTSRNQSLKN
ncbi:MAG: cobalamin B12-binding domain-containing protein [Chloroherpetonaceae bacterium]|nr:cobalamin B12-binding domain-containing protein [Chloroherpetonaceae bacterium]